MWISWTLGLQSIAQTSTNKQMQQASVSDDSGLPVFNERIPNSSITVHMAPANWVRGNQREVDRASPLICFGAANLKTRQNPFICFGAQQDKFQLPIIRYRKVHGTGRTSPFMCSGAQHDKIPNIQ